jgi:pyruvate dehydrogenase E1 component alpha subunit
MNSVNKIAEKLANPKKFQDPIDVSNYEIDFVLNLLKQMLVIRLSEEKLARERELGNIGGPVHLSAGQEAIAVGVCKNLTREDRVFGGHRSHSHLLSLNPSSYRLFAEVLGKETGFSKGMGGSMHLIDQKSGFYGSVPIVAGTVPLAVGAGFDALRSKTKHIGVAFIGDGAVEEGIFQESLNLARVLPSPTLFVVENNLFSSHMHISLRQPLISTTRFADANEIKSVLVDGNNVIEVYEKTRLLLETTRDKGEPAFLEGITFRQFGHVDWRKDIDVGVSRSQTDIDDWLLRDPIRRLVLGMKDCSFISTKDFNDMSNDILNEIESNWFKALNDPFPSEDKLISRVYSNEN